ncbi:hypothetical protein [Embleya sp. MST-111070]|uniref:hypothetical protein n=1 Tax=Embleya sp. MST-111070 TaxID=3398231 RepID=UPI003F73A185
MQQLGPHTVQKQIDLPDGLSLRVTGKERNSDDPVPLVTHDGAVGIDGSESDIGHWLPERESDVFERPSKQRTITRSNRATAQRALSGVWHLICRHGNAMGDLPEQKCAEPGVMPLIMGHLARSSSRSGDWRREQ